MDWHIGQRVVCVQDSFIINIPVTHGIMTKPVKGQVYTIRGFNIGTPEWPINGSGVGLYLEEIQNKELPFGEVGGPIVWKEMSFDQRAFRPVRKTDISVFTKTLRTTKEYVRG